jgi:membrane protease YdiL (CAAX protease family)
VNIAALVFLVVLFVIMPRMALRSARQMRQALADGAPLPRLRMALSTLFALSVLWFLSQMNALMLGRSLFAVGAIGMREIGIGLIGLAVLLLAIPLSRAMRDPSDERKRLVHALAPRDAKEYAVFVVIAIAAGIAEEAAYRGVALWILQPVFGSLAPAVLLSAMSFSVTHAVQGSRAMIIVFAIALVFHAMVYLTNTLVIAMVVHAVYDCIAGMAAAKRARELAAEDATKAAAPAVTAG